MDRRPLLVLAVACLVLFAGCASLISSRESDTTPTVETTQGTTQEETTKQAETTTKDTDETTTDDSGDSTTTTTTTATTTDESWSQPKDVNKPLQIKYEDESENHIKSLAVDGEGSSAEGYSSVDVTVTGNTSMPKVDPDDHGDIEGEPFIVIYINGHLVTSEDSNFATPRGVLVSRTPELQYNENGEFTVSVPKDAFEAAGVEKGEEVDLMVMLMDRDEEWDDIYGKQFVKVKYNPDA